MAAAADKVMEYVEKALAKDPGVSNQVLYEGARKIDKSIGKLSIRQFHAKYPLQVKRRKGPTGKGKGKGKPRKTTTRKKRASARSSRTSRSRSRPAPASGAGAEGIRKVLFEFARDLSAADTQLGTIEVMSNLDRYTADILKATRS